MLYDKIYLFAEVAKASESEAKVVRKTRKY